MEKARTNRVRYLKVREVIGRELAEGRYLVGERFPTDQELCERFSVSRHTVRAALRELQEEGYLMRQRGAGTVVSAPTSPPYVQEFASLSELDDYAAHTTFKCIVEGTVVAAEPLAHELDCEPGSKWLRLAGLRYRKDDANPLCWTEIFLSKDLVADRTALRKETGPFYERVCRLKGMAIDRVDQQVRAVAISKEHAVFLNYPEGAPALLVRRTYVSELDTPFEISLSVHPADRYVSHTRLKRRRISPLYPHGQRDKS